MKSERAFPLKVSLHGMSERMQKMMENYLVLVCSDVARLAHAEEALAEIVDVDSPQGNNLLKERLANRPSKPIIVLSINEVTSTDVIYVKKPIVVPVFVHALMTVNDMIQSKKVLKKTIPNKTLIDAAEPKPEKSNKGSSRSSSKQNNKRLSAKRKVRSEKKKISKEANKLLNQITKIDESFNIDSSPKNQRETVRYIFDGIVGTLKIKKLLGRSETVKVLDLSSKGAHIGCDSVLKLQANVVLNLQLTPEQGFRINAKVIRGGNNSYGLLFEKHQHDLIDFLIDSAHPYNLTY